METRPITDLHDARSAAIEPPAILRDYHYRRIDRIQSGEFDVETDSKGIILVHVASVDSLKPYTGDRIDVEELINSGVKIPLLKRTSYADFKDRGNFCARGVQASKSHAEDGAAYTWIDRTSMLEAISTDLVYEKKNPGTTIGTETLEKAFTSIVEWYLSEIVDSDQDSVFVIMSYLNMDGVHTSRVQRRFSSTREIETSFIETPVLTVSPENVREQLTPLLRPFWQAAGYGSSPYMSEEGWEFGNNE